MALHEGYKSGKIKEKDKVLLTSFGSGMTYGALIFQA
jgi:3-oxoacyl-[acyl-carrier-protein] synthase III